MEQHHKDFILNELIPFIMRDYGNGFAMEEWKRQWSYKLPEVLFLDYVAHRRPQCGMVCCIGGSVCILKKDELEAFKGQQEEKPRAYYADMTFTFAASMLGLTSSQAEVLFYQWHRLWPEPYRTDFDKADDALRKAEIACVLLRKVVETNGSILSVSLEESIRRH